jgi:hypothetical protein
MRHMTDAKKFYPQDAQFHDRSKATPTVAEAPPSRDDAAWAAFARDLVSDLP